MEPASMGHGKGVPHPAMWTESSAKVKRKPQTLDCSIFVEAIAGETASTSIGELCSLLGCLRTTTFSGHTNKEARGLFFRLVGSSRWRADVIDRKGVACCCDRTLLLCHERASLSPYINIVHTLAGNVLSGCGATGRGFCLSVLCSVLVTPDLPATGSRPRFGLQVSEAGLARFTMPVPSTSSRRVL